MHVNFFSSVVSAFASEDARLYRCAIQDTSDHWYYKKVFVVDIEEAKEIARKSLCNTNAIVAKGINCTKCDEKTTKEEMKNTDHMYP